MTIATRRYYKRTLPEDKPRDMRLDEFAERVENIGLSLEEVLGFSPGNPDSVIGKAFISRPYDNDGEKKQRITGIYRSENPPIKKEIKYVRVFCGPTPSEN